MGRRYPPHQSIYSRFCKWRDADILETVFHILNADLENLSYIKANPQSGGAKKGHSIQNASHLLVQVMVGKSTKIHAIVDELGNPISFLLSCSQIHDSKIALSLLETIDIHGSRIMADRAGSKEICEYIIQYHAIYIILPKRNTKKHGLWIGIFISNDIWLNAFFINSNSFIVLLLDMINWHLPFLLLLLLL